MKNPALFAKSLVAKNVWNLINGTGLWVQIAIKKYITPLTLLDWIRVSVKKKKGIFICWKAVLWSFDLIGQSLVWKVGTGVEVCIGIDPWLGYKWRHSLPVSMIVKLHNEGYFVLRDIACMGIALLQEQGWLNADLLGFDEQEIII